MEKNKIKTGGKIFGAFLLGVICTSGVSYAGNTGLIGDLFELVTNPDSTQNLYIKDNAFKDNSIDADALKDGSVGLEEIGGNQIVTQHIKDGTITSADVKDNSLTASDLGKNSVSSDELVDEPTVSSLIMEQSGRPKIEMRSTGGNNPYIDMSNDPDNNYDARIMLTDDNVIQIYGADLRQYKTASNNYDLTNKGYVDSEINVLKDYVDSNIPVKCDAGKYNRNNVCVTCPKGYYCMGGYTILECPSSMPTTLVKYRTSGAKNKNECFVDNIPRMPTTSQVSMSGMAVRADSVAIERTSEGWAKKIILTYHTAAKGRALPTKNEPIGIRSASSICKYYGYNGSSVVESNTDSRKGNHYSYTGTSWSKSYNNSTRALRKLACY